MSENKTRPLCNSQCLSGGGHGLRQSEGERRPRVGESDYGDRVDRSGWSIFGLGRNTRRKTFPAVAAWWRRWLAGGRIFWEREEGDKRIDYDEVFAPVARIEAIRIFLAFASYMGFIVYLMDVKSAFLYGTIDEEVYVSQTPSFVDPNCPKKVYKAVKALYGLQQAPRAWYATLSTFLLKSGYRKGTINKTLFIKKDKNNIMLVQVYVDDIIFGSTKKSWCDGVEALMKSRFQMSSMGELTFFLGLQVRLLVHTKLETQKPLVKDEEATDVDVHLYRSMIGSLMYLTASRPDIMYLKGKPKLGLWYPRVSSFDLEAYSDSDYAGANLDRKSTTGAKYVAAAKLLVDNSCGIQNLIFHSKTKHIEIRHHFIRDAYEKKLIQVLKIHTDDNVADLLTKAFDVSRESLVRDIDGTEPLLLPDLLILWLTTVSTDSAKLVPLGKDSTAIKPLKKIPPRLVLNTTWLLTWKRLMGIQSFMRSSAFLREAPFTMLLLYITAKVAGKPVSISEASIRSNLLFNEVDGIYSLPNQAIFDAIQLMRYEGDLTVLTFNKALFSPQWRFLFHTMNHCISSKSTFWDQIPTNIAIAVICLTTNQKYNFSKLIFNGMMRHLDAKKKFVMYPRFISVFLDKQLKNVPVPLDHFPINALTNKVFSFMVKKGKHFSGKVTPLFPNMLVQPTEDEGEGSERPSEPQPIPSPPHPSTDQHETHTNLSPRPSPTSHITDSIQEGSGGNHRDQAKEIKHLKAQINKLKKKAKPVITHYRAWMKSVSMKQRLAGKKSLKKQWMQMEFVSKEGRKSAKAEPTVHKDPAFDELDDDVIDYMETEDA
ncbi:putative ribonuclease H-like domain-containing protein [Tanacetum coccineum]|uniref:Ribonuclease H-like domain-containing protein n=1 Tax=Tanacetum coccineum TaxID=301880 RepID=A0ABQ4XP77_9ASTR